MTKNISAWKISSLNEHSVQIRLGSNLGGLFYFRKKEDAYGRKSGSDESNHTVNVQHLIAPAKAFPLCSGSVASKNEFLAIYSHLFA